MVKRSTAGLRSSWSSRRFTMRPGEGEGEGEGGGKAVGRIAAVRITVGLFPLENIREPYTADRYRACRCSACRLVRMAAVPEAVALTTVVCVARLLACVQLGEPRLGGLCLGRRAPASGHRPVRSPRAWRRQAGAARAGGAVVSIRGGCGGARAVLTKRPCAAACVRKLRLRSSLAFSTSSRVHGPLGRRAASAWSRVRASSVLVRRGGGGHARRHRVLPCPCVVAAGTALSQVSIRGRSTGTSTQ